MKNAIVIGGSMAGLLAARVLAGHCQQVTVIERDPLPKGPALRKGVPQAAHAHLLLVRGLAIMETLFPGLTDEALKAGAARLDSAAGMLWYSHGVYKSRQPVGLPLMTMTRPLMEWLVRTRTMALPNVTIMYSSRVTGLLSSRDHSRVTGVTVEPVDGSVPPRPLQADLVVDAGGRGTRAPQWLAALDYPAVPVTEVTTRVAYASRLFRLTGPEPDFSLAVMQADMPSTRVGVLMRVEGDRWLLTLQAMLGDVPPDDDAGFAEFAGTLPDGVVKHFLQNAEPLSAITASRTPSNLRRHYERMDRFPEGLVVLGDAVCSFNPRYAQGIAVAALGAEVLQRTLGGPAAGLSHRFQSQLARAIESPWQASTGEDFAYPQTEGKRPAGVGFMNWYARRLVRLTAIDHLALSTFFQVVHLVKPAAALFRPGLVWRVLTGGMKPHRPAPAQTQVSAGRH